VRFLDPGNVPIPAEARRMERERLDQRERAKGAPLGYDDVVADLEHIVGSAVL
jgi:glutamate mutase epsilon subunit